MEALEDMLKGFMSLNEDDIFNEAVDNPETKELIVYLQTVDQLRNRGVDAHDEPLPPYSPATKKRKIEEGETWQHMTLKDTGEMHRSTDVEVGYEEIIIEMDTIKGGEDLTRRYDFVGLTDNNLARVSNDIQPRIIEKIEEHVYKGF